MHFQSIDELRRYRPLEDQLRDWTCLPGVCPRSLRATPFVSRSKIAIAPLAVPDASRFPCRLKRIHTAVPELLSFAVSVSGMSCARTKGSTSERFMAMSVKNCWLQPSSVFVKLQIAASRVFTLSVMVSSLSVDHFKRIK